MKFDIEHTFAVSAADYEKLYFDEPFQKALCDAVKLGREVLKFERNGDKIIRHVRVAPARELPAPVAKVLGGKAFSYVEELEFEAGKGRGKWRTVPNIFPEKVVTDGTIEFVAVGPSSCKRIVRGEIEVKVFGIGGIIERFVGGEVEKSYGDAAAFTSKWIAENKA
jgi:hypothetical protein